MNEDALLASRELRDQRHRQGGFDIELKEFDFRDDGGVVYDKNGVKISHWRQSDVTDGASADRLDWNGMRVACTGGGRPNSLTAKYAKATSTTR
ncbi:MAG: hypothetical protein ACREMR_08210 [Gemmatimonadales bacterium]